MHNGFVRVDEEKMSKSLGNFFTVREILASFDAEVVRYFILRAHYRSPLNYSRTHLEDAKQALTRLYTALKGKATGHPARVDWQAPSAQRFSEAMDDDFGTPEAIAVLHELANEAFQGRPEAAGQLKGLANFLGLLQREPESFLQGGPLELDAGKIEALIAARRQARQRKDFKTADDIRRQLLAKGVILEDSGSATTWRRS
jgi:cysteinyl-tRNA synthetase